MSTSTRLPTFVSRLAAATNAHDVERVADCFTPDYVNHTPNRPSQGFRGQAQVRRNWTGIFAGVPDVQATVLRGVQEGRTVWSEWEMRGHRRDGAHHLMRGVIVFEVTEDDARARSATFYLAPVTLDDVDADHAVRQVLGDGGR